MVWMVAASVSPRMEGLFSVADGIMDYELLPETAQLLALWKQGNEHMKMGIEHPKSIDSAMKLIDGLSKYRRGAVIIDAITLLDVAMQVIQAMKDGESTADMTIGLPDDGR
jgi:hypothetical protein